MTSAEHDRGQRIVNGFMTLLASGLQRSTASVTTVALSHLPLRGKTTYEPQAWLVAVDWSKVLRFDDAPRC